MLIGGVDKHRLNFFFGEFELKNIVLKCLLSIPVVFLMGCAANDIGYGNRTFNPDPDYEAKIIADRKAVQAEERAERKERRDERKEEMNNVAEAYQKATKGKKYIRCYWWGCY